MLKKSIPDGFKKIAGSVSRESKHNLYHVMLFLLQKKKYPANTNQQLNKSGKEKCVKVYFGRYYSRNSNTAAAQHVNLK